MHRAAFALTLALLGLAIAPAHAQDDPAWPEPDAADTPEPDAPEPPGDIPDTSTDVDDVPPPDAPPEADEEGPSLFPATNEAGLSGFHDVVDGRIVKHGTIGGTFAYNRLDLTLEDRIGGSTLKARARLHDYDYALGFGLFDIVEIGMVVPYREQQVRAHVTGAGRVVDQESDDFEDLIFSAKAGITLEMISLAAYARVEAPSGDDRVTASDQAEGELGAAVTLSLSDGLFEAHMNLAFLDVEGGSQFFKYRFAVSSEIGIDAFKVRPFAFLSATEAEGPGGSDVWLGWGVQAFIAKIGFIELSNEHLAIGDGIAGVNQGGYHFRMVAGASFTF